MLNPIIRHIVSFFLFLFINSFVLIAQERGLLVSKYYSPKDYNAPSQNWSIVQDNRGVLYFGNSSCILEYDGNEWRKIHVPNNSTVRTIAIDNNNNLYVGAYEEFGLLLPDKNGTLTYNSLIHLIDSNYSNFGDVWDIHCFDEDVFFLTDNYLFRYKNQKIDCWERNKERYYLSYKVNKNLYVQEIGKGLLKFKNDSLVLIKKGEFFADKRIHSILPLDDKLVICTRTKGLFLYDDSDEDVQIIPFSNISTNALNLNNYFIKNVFYHGIKISNNLFAMSTITGGVLLVDVNWDVVDVINHESTGVISQAHYLYYQKDRALWMALSNGICQVDILSPFRYWNDDKGINGTISDIASLDDKHYVSTGSGVYYSKREKDNINYSINNFTPVKGKFEQAWGFLYFILPDSNYKTTEELLNDREAYFSPSSDKMSLLVATSTGLYQIINDNSIQISDYKAIFKIYQYKKDPSKIFLGLANGIALMSYLNGKWTNHGMKFDINDQIRDINEDSLGNVWASASYKGVDRIKKPLLSQEHNIVNLYNTLDGLPSVQSVQFAKINKELFYMSANNYFVFNSSEDSFIIDKNPYSTTDSIQEDHPYDSLSWNKVLENTISRFYITTQTADSIIWFSTTDGTFRYYVTNQKDYFNIFPVLIRNVLSGDSIIYNGTNYKRTESDLDSISSGLIINSDSKVHIGTILDFKNNSLTFNYSLPFYEDELKNEYSYFLEGYDKTWSPWNPETKKEYTNLREGDYTFKVKSRNLYTLESPASEFKFKILPPWYRSFAAILGYILLGIVLIIVIVRLYTYRLIREKDKLEKIVIERTQEILMQKEEILVQSEHLKKANERITAKNEELEKQKWEIINQALKLKKANVELIKLSKAASETDNAITIFDKDGNVEWVNEGFKRMYGYSLKQYKSEKNINIVDSSDNPNIKEAIQSCINNKKSVVYESKTKTRDGKELWAQTTLTHVVDKDGETLNLIAIESDITKIKLAENEIAEQRDKLALSNATKNKFFRIIAHDLRNPISTLAGSTNLIFNDFDEYNKEQTKGFIGELNKLSQTTFNLLENLLDWSSTQMGEIRFSPKPIDIYSLTAENIELIKQKVDSKNIQLKLNLEKNTIAFADENMVKTVIRNMLSNAVKFTPENGEIKISCYIDKEFVKYSVKDSGIGISEEDQKKLFRIDTHHSTPGLSNEKGSGLGLILCKEFVEKHGGKIWVKSEIGKGSVFYFTLPVQ
ncbi:MAG: PAS domain S-box protein [Bacteroidales bacterium]|nr:PAS domain S-box protein [Bacteroidales bacterium]